MKNAFEFFKKNSTISSFISFILLSICYLYLYNSNIIQEEERLEERRQASQELNILSQELDQATQEADKAWQELKALSQESQKASQELKALYRNHKKRVNSS